MSSILSTPEIDEEIHEVPWVVVPLVISAAASFLLGVYPAPVLELAAAARDSIFPVLRAIP